MRYIHAPTGTYPYQIALLGRDHPGTSFPVWSELSEDMRLQRLADFGVHPMQPSEPPAHNRATHKVTEVQPAFVDGIWTQQWVVTLLSASEVSTLVVDLKVALIARATDARWRRETGGITLPNGVHVGTSIEDQNRITSVIANAQLAGVSTVDFKATTGWVTLTLAEVQGIAAAIALHVQACFSAERAHHEAIEALTSIEALQAYDVTAGWPATNSQG